MTKRILTLLILTVIILSALSGCAVSPEKIDLHTTEGQGSIRYDVTDVKIESGVCTVTYEEIAPPGTADLEYWIIFISIPKEISAQITEYKTYMPTAEWYQ